MAGALEDTQRDAKRNCELHWQAARLEFSKYRHLGITVVVVTTIVGASTFSALMQNNHDPFVQMGVGILSILAAVLSAIQTFYSHENRSRAHAEFAMECYDIAREINYFFKRYPAVPSDPLGREDYYIQQGVIDARYAGAKKGAPMVPLSVRQMASKPQHG